MFLRARPTITSPFKKRKIQFISYSLEKTAPPEKSSGLGFSYNVVISVLLPNGTSYFLPLTSYFKNNSLIFDFFLIFICWNNFFVITLHIYAGNMRWCIVFCWPSTHDPLDEANDDWTSGSNTTGGRAWSKREEVRWKTSRCVSQRPSWCRTEPQPL